MGNNAIISEPSFPGNHLLDQNNLSLMSQIFLYLLCKKVNILNNQKTMFRASLVAQ